MQIPWLSNFSFWFIAVAKKKQNFITQSTQNFEMPSPINCLKLSFCPSTFIQCLNKSKKQTLEATMIKNLYTFFVIKLRRRLQWIYLTLLLDIKTQWQSQVCCNSSKVNSELSVLAKQFFRWRRHQHWKLPPH